MIDTNLMSQKRFVSSPPPQTPAKKIRPSKLSILRSQSPQVNLLVRSPHSPDFVNSQVDYLKTIYQSVGRVAKTRFYLVKKARHVTENIEYAIKKSLQPASGELQLGLRRKEVERLQALKGKPNCLQLIESWEQGGTLYMASPYYKCGSLEGVEKTKLQEKTIWVTLKDVATGLFHIHAANIVHLDIKPSNIFVGEDGSMVVGDFGISISLDEQYDETETDGDGIYVSPEAVNSKPCKASDIFNLGVLILSLCSSKEVQAVGHDNESRELLRSGRPDKLSKFPFREGISQALYDLTLQMLSLNPNERPTAEQILSHPSITSLTERDILLARNELVSSMDEPKLCSDHSSDDTIATPTDELDFDTIKFEPTRKKLEFQF